MPPQMQKTEKSMAELELDMNNSYEFGKICESGVDLVPLRGPAYTGLTNLGNSCYMNSVLQVKGGGGHCGSGQNPCCSGLVP